MQQGDMPLGSFEKRHLREEAMDAMAALLNRWLVTEPNLTVDQISDQDLEDILEVLLDLGWSNRYFL